VPVAGPQRTTTVDPGRGTGTGPGQPLLTAEAPDALWVADFERHEALAGGGFDQAGPDRPNLS
jgi:hypothetical protein